ncbi:phosphohydrolase [Ureibacillus manganicus DSM 26584]|uniref:Phosphohydrolase n=1 Tax=Ureibacillus manganicus DSM 26584 TaxID=1384049 RepID=A0A0A3I4T1_9BACL|nr:phosphohydrolase [Ureibacillus manganicus DSM 26584]
MHYNRFLNIINFRTFLVIVLVITGLLQFILMFENVRSVTYDIETFELAPETIRSAKTVEDTFKTEKERDEAEKLVEEVFIFNNETVEHRMELINSIFEIILDVRTNFERSSILPVQPEGVGVEVQQPSKETQIIALREKLAEITVSQSQLTFSDDHLWSLLSSPKSDLQIANNTIQTLVKEKLNNQITKEQVNSAKNEIENEVRQNTSIDDTLINASIVIARGAIVETYLLDQAKTDELKKQARESVEPTRILQGQIIVQEGQLVDREVYRELELLGMLDNHESFNPIIGLMILIVIQMSFLYILFDRSKMELTKKRNAVLVTSIVYSLSIVLMELMSLIVDEFDVTVAFLYPTALATMIVRLLCNDKIASLLTVLIATSAGVIFQEGYAAVLQMDIALYITFGGFASIFFMRSIEKRSDLLKACGVVAIINVAFIAFYLLMIQTDFGLMELLFYGIAAVVSGLLSGALTMGLLPFFESAFGLLSTMRLIELSNPNHPLLKKLLTETPGTYHHSVMVANLAEAACEAIGADGFLARVGCYYHDIGKTKRPAFFIENQMSGINPHDSLPPERSAEIIIAHTTDGAELLARHKMPKEIIDIALQHHGTSTLKFFVHKAKEQGKEVDEALFSYPGPKPQTKEAAVISIADSVEAAVRSMKSPNSEKIRNLVHSIIQSRVQENQFDECDVSIKELKIIEEALCNTLNGIFHSRIEYPKEG